MKHIKKNLIQALLWLMLGLVPQLAWAEVPNAINYQGYLTDSSGTPLKGTVNVTLKFWDALTGGNTIGSQKSYTNVEVNNGVFSQNVDVSDITFDKPVYVETMVNGETLAPRQLVTSVPSSQLAEQAEQDQDTLGGLNCATDQIAKWNGSAWVCADDNAASGGVTSITARSGLVANGTSQVILSVADGGITSRKLANASVNGNKIAANSITGDKISFNYAKSNSKGGAALNALNASNLSCSNCVSGSEISSGQVVKSLNGFKDNVRIAEGTGIKVEQTANTITISASASSSSLLSIDSTNYQTVTVDIDSNTVINIEEIITLQSNEDVNLGNQRFGINKMHINGGGFIGNGSQTVAFGRYSVITGGHFKDVTLDGNDVTFVGCTFEGNVEFGVGSHIIHSTLSNGSVSLNGATLSGTRIHGAIVTSGIDSIDSSYISDSSFSSVRKIVNSKVYDTILKVRIAVGNDVDDSKITLSANAAVFTGNTCERTTLKIPDTSDGQITVSGNVFSDRHAKEEGVIVINANSSWYRNFLISGNNFKIQSTDSQAILITGSPTGTYQILKISGNTFVNGQNAIIHVGNFKTVVTDNLVYKTSKGIGMKHNDGYSWVPDNSNLNIP